MQQPLWRKKYILKYENETMKTVSFLDQAMTKCSVNLNYLTEVEKLKFKKLDARVFLYKVYGKSPWEK